MLPRDIDPSPSPLTRRLVASRARALAPRARARLATTRHATRPTPHDIVLAAAATLARTTRRRAAPLPPSEHSPHGGVVRVVEEEMGGGGGGSIIYGGGSGASGGGGSSVPYSEHLAPLGGVDPHFHGGAFLRLQLLAVGAPNANAPPQFWLLSAWRAAPGAPVGRDAQPFAALPDGKVITRRGGGGGAG